MYSSIAFHIDTEPKLSDYLIRWHCERLPFLICGSLSTRENTGETLVRGHLDARYEPVSPQLYLTKSESTDIMEVNLGGPLEKAAVSRQKLQCFAAKEWGRSSEEDKRFEEFLMLLPVDRPRLRQQVQ